MHLSEQGDLDAKKKQEITENKMKMSNSAQTQQRTFNADGKFA